MVKLDFVVVYDCVKGTGCRSWVSQTTGCMKWTDVYSSGPRYTTTREWQFKLLTKL